MALLLALGSGLSFGAADFAGGLAAKRSHAVSVTLVSQAVGVVVLVLLMGALPGRPSAAAFTTGALAGVAGALSLVAYLRALALGPMGVVSPLASVAGVMVPVAAGVALGERPTLLAAVGIVLGVVAVTIVAAGRRVERRAALSTGPLLALLGGAGFGVFFVLLDRTPDGSGLWPFVGARASSLVMLGLIVAVGRAGLPSREAMPLVALSGGLDMLANVMFLLAARTGLLTIAALLTSMYPIVVVVLARHLLAERLGRPQQLAVGLSLAAVGVITVA
ncbi:MAG TPA: EamA family transporter [Euzebyales bacterium]|nr:EamA family transporter [Euzebyales bacterium]